MRIHSPVLDSAARVRIFRLALAFLAVSCLTAPGQEALYQADLSKAELGKLPSEFMSLNGEFTVKEESGKRFLELPGAPLDTFQLLFGPPRKDGIAASARCWGAKRGRLFPTFAVGLNGQSGHRIQVSPGKGTVELYRGDEIVASKPFIWENEKWTWLKIEVVKTGEKEWTVRGKAWIDGTPEPAEGLLSTAFGEEPVNGRASIWGSPFSGKEIRFDGLKLTRAGP